MMQPPKIFQGIRMLEYHDAAVRVRYAETDQMGRRLSRQLSDLV